MTVASALRPPTSYQMRKMAIMVEASLLQEDFISFVKAAWHVVEPSTPLKWGWAMDAICMHLEAVTDGRIKRLLMNVPPGCMKSLMTGVFWPAWEWADERRRGYRYMGTSHKQDLAMRDNMKCRRLIQSNWYQERWPIALVNDQNAKMKFENEYTGFREAMAFTSMTGSRGDRVILDDPLSVDSANSIADVLNCELTFTEALPTRVNNNDSAIVVIMQRLHEGDPSGIILDRDLGYEHLMLPMRFEPERRCKTSIGFVDPRTYDGELLFPERFPESQVVALERVMGTYAVAGQFQQRPTPRGGGLFKREFLQLWPRGRPLPSFQYVVQSYDTAYTDKTANDPTAMTCWGVFDLIVDGQDNRRCAMLLDAWDEHLNYPELRKRVIKGWNEVYGEGDAINDVGRRADAVLVEEKGSGIGLVQDMQAARVPVRTYNPGRADKYSRGQQALPLYEMKCFFIPESKVGPRGEFVTWAEPFVTQLGKFGPAVTTHDDYVDTFTQMTIFLRDSGLLLLPEAKNDKEEDEKPGKSKKKGNPYGQ